MAEIKLIPSDSDSISERLDPAFAFTNYVEGAVYTFNVSRWLEKMNIYVLLASLASQSADTLQGYGQRKTLPVGTQEMQ